MKEWRGGGKTEWKCERGREGMARQSRRNDLKNFFSGITDINVTLFSTLLVIEYVIIMFCF